jgi:hypothetical protein
LLGQLTGTYHLLTINHVTTVRDGARPVATIYVVAWAEVIACQDVARMALFLDQLHRGGPFLLLPVVGSGCSCGVVFIECDNIRSPSGCNRWLDQCPRAWLGASSILQSWMFVFYLNSS